MKTRISLAFMIMAACALLMFNSCSRLRTINLHKTYSDINFTIKAPQSAGIVDIEEAIDADLQEMASSNGFNISSIESATINSISLKIMDSSATPYTFSIVDNATCSFYADGATVAEVGTDDASHTSPTQIDFDLKGVDVANYLKASQFKVKLHLQTNAPITHDVPMNATIECTFKVKTSNSK